MLVFFAEFADLLVDGGADVFAELVDVIADVPAHGVAAGAKLDSADQVVLPGNGHVRIALDELSHGVANLPGLLVGQFECGGDLDRVGVGERVLQLTFRFVVEVGGAVQECRHHALLQIGVGEVGEDLSAEFCQAVGRPATQVGHEVGPAVFEGLQPALLLPADLLLGLPAFLAAVLVGVVAGLLHQLIALAVQLVALLPEFFGALLGVGFGLLGLVETLLDGFFPLVHRLENAVVEEDLQQHHEDEEVDDLCSDGDPVNHGRLPGVTD